MIVLYTNGILFQSRESGYTTGRLATRAETLALVNLISLFFLYFSLLLFCFIFFRLRVDFDFVRFLFYFICYYFIISNFFIWLIETMISFDGLNLVLLVSTPIL